MELVGFEYGYKNNTKRLEDGNLLISKKESYFIIYKDDMDAIHSIDALEIAKNVENLKKSQRLKDDGALDFFQKLCRKEISYTINNDKLEIVSEKSKGCLAKKGRIVYCTQS